MIYYASDSEMRRRTDLNGLVIRDVIFGTKTDVEFFIDQINEEFSLANILLYDSRFEDAYVFPGDNADDILLVIDENVEVDFYELELWNDENYVEYGGIMFKDYINEHLGGFIINEKPDCKLIGENGNIFNLVGIAARTLKNNHMAAEAKEMTSRVMSSDSYAKALTIIGEYVNITGNEEYDEEDEEESEEAEDDEAHYMNMN